VSIAPDPVGETVRHKGLSDVDSVDFYGTEETSVGVAAGPASVTASVTFSPAISAFSAAADSSYPDSSTPGASTWGKTNAFNHIVRECHHDGVAVDHKHDRRLLLCDGVPLRLRRQWRTHRAVDACGLRRLCLNDAFWHNLVTARREQREYGCRSRSHGVLAQRVLPLYRLVAGRESDRSVGHSIAPS
jgi:hypothetical protein